MPELDAACCYRRREVPSAAWLVCVEHTAESCENDWTNQYVVWTADLRSAKWQITLERSARGGDAALCQNTWLRVITFRLHRMHAVYAASFYGQNGMQSGCRSHRLCEPRKKRLNCKWAGLAGRLFCRMTNWPCAASLIGGNAVTWRWALSYVHRFTVTRGDIIMSPGWHYNVTPGDVTWRLLNANVRYILRCFCLGPTFCLFFGVLL